MIIPSDLTSPQPSKAKWETSKCLKIDHNTFAMAIDVTNHETDEMTSIDRTNHETRTWSTIDQTNHVKMVIKKENQPEKSAHFNENGVVNEIKKQVCFDEIVFVRPVLHIDDYKDEEVLKCWYPYKKKSQRKAELRDILQLVRDGKFDECTRGLERLSQGGTSRNRRKNSIQDILEEQKAQRAELKENQCSQFVYDDIRLRMAYRSHSRAALQIAHAMGKVDEMAADCRRIVDQDPPNRKCKKKNKEISCSHTGDHGSFLQLDFSQ